MNRCPLISALIRFSALTLSLAIVSMMIAGCGNTAHRSQVLDEQEGHAALRQGYDETAIRSFSRAIAHGKSGIGAYRGRGTAYYRIGGYTEAIADFSQVLIMDPTDVWSYRRRAYCYSKLGMLELATADLTEAIKYAPNDAQILGDRAMVYSKHGQHEKAIRDYGSAIALRRELGTKERDTLRGLYFIGRAQAYLECRDFEAALRDLDDASTFERFRGDALYYRAQVYDAMGDADLGAEFRRQAKQAGYRLPIEP